MSLSNRFKQVVVVEGYHDLSRLKSIYPNLDVVITNGSEISLTTLKELKMLNEKRGLLLFLDPDVPGERIRRIINAYVGPTDHAFLPKEKCISRNRRKVGIEHAEKNDIIKALKDYRKTTHMNEELSLNDLLELGLTGGTNSKSRREKLCNNLGIGLANGKTLLHKLQMFGITKEEVKNNLR
jgi:ribonuclease M5